MTMLPLVAGLSADDPIAYQDGVAIPVRQFLRDVARVAAALPPVGHVLNNCRDRYQFAVGFAASLASGRISLLPSTLTPEVIAQLRNFAPDTVCLSDQAPLPGLPELRYPAATKPAPAPTAEDLAMPMIPAERVAAYVFTSGSTGTPVPHAKYWGDLAACVQSQAARQGAHYGAFASLVGTVPPQHMYGLESTVLIALQGGVALAAARPFYPADIVAALAAMPAPRLLVTTPVHLHALLEAGLVLPAIALVISATAPMPPGLAARTEARLGAPLLEIYGSTETGQIATRRTAATDLWQLLPGITLRTGEVHAMAEGGHLAGPTILNDVLEAVDTTHFRLLGRTADLVNIAGKRSSLAYLNHHLQAIAGVADGAFFIPDTADPGGVTRLMAFVVAPSLTVEGIRAALAACLDPVFLPRPLIRVAALPRNQTGKLPREALAALAVAYAAPRSSDMGDVA